MNAFARFDRLTVNYAGVLYFCVPVGATYFRAFCTMLRIKVKASLLGLACGRDRESYDESTIRSGPALKNVN
jgi:hypothetical protein